jgi:hypothetical protein
VLPQLPPPEDCMADRALDPEAIAKAEQFAWEFIKDGRDPAAFDRFIEIFPTSSFVALARAQLDKLAEQAWASLASSEDVAALEGFVRSFPKHARAAEAGARVQVLRERTEEAASWERIKDSDDLAAVDAHLALFPDGLNAANARTKRETLQREREPAEHWRNISDAKDSATFENFLKAYSDSPYAAKARERLDEINRALENADWNSVRGERHPAPLLHFLVVHPAGAHAEEALAALANLPKAIEEEAWAAVKDCNEPIVLRGFLAALPHSGHARELQTRLGTARPSPPPSPPRPAAAPVPGADPNKKAFVRQALFWSAIALLGLFALIATIFALVQMRSNFGWNETSVATGIAWASVFLGVMVLLLFFAGPRLYSWPPGSLLERMLFFHAVGSIGLVRWVLITQSSAELAYESWDNVRPGTQVGFFIVVAIVDAVALIALWLRNRWWARAIYYLVLLAIGMIEFAANTYSFPAMEYWVTEDLLYCGGLVLLLFAVVGLVTDVVARLPARVAAAPSPAPPAA